MERRRKRRIELNLYLEDLEWMGKMAQARKLPESKSEIVSQAVYALRERMGG